MIPAAQNRTSAPRVASRVVKLKRHTRGRYFKIVAGLLSLILATPLLSAMEAHLVNVTAEFAQIDPPILTPPGNVPIGDTTGGVDLMGTVEVDMTHDDVDGTHIFYTFGPGTDPNTIPDPACGNAGANAGGGPIVPGETGLITLNFDSDTTIKAITCDGDTNDAHKSIINIKRYFFKGSTPDECEDKEFVIPGDLAVLGSGDGSAKSDVKIAANVEIEGNAHSNRNLGSAQSLLADINGNASAGGTVASPPLDVSGTVTNGAADVSLPTIDQAFWKAQASSGGEIPGDVVFAPNSPTITLGPKTIFGDLEIGANNTWELTGPVHITGNLTIHSNVNVNQTENQADKYSLIIVDGKVDIKANVSFNAEDDGAFLIVSNSVAVTGQPAALEVASNSQMERVVVLATLGDARLRANGNLAAIFAQAGFDNSDAAVRLEANSEIGAKKLPKFIGCGQPPPDPCEEDADTEAQNIALFGKRGGHHGDHGDDGNDDCDPPPPPPPPPCDDDDDDKWKEKSASSSGKQKDKNDCDPDDDPCKESSNAGLSAFGRGRGGHNDHDGDDDNDCDDQCFNALGNNHHDDDCKNEDDDK